MTPEPAARQAAPPTFTSARTKLLVSFGAAVAAGTAAAVAGAGRAALLTGWDILALTFCGWVWSALWRLDAESTAGHARREEPSRDLADLVLLGAAVASLAASPSGDVSARAPAGPVAGPYGERNRRPCRTLRRWRG